MNILALLIAMIAVESNSDTYAYNYSENAAGVLQIRPIMVEDLNRIAGHKKYTLTDRWNAEKSIRMALDYWNHYCTEDRLGYKPTLKTLAMSWNAGFEGMKRGNGKKYWELVRKQLKENNK